MLAVRCREFAESERRADADPDAAEIQDQDVSDGRRACCFGLLYSTATATATVTAAAISYCIDPGSNQHVIEDFFADSFKTRQ